MPQSCKITADMLVALRERTGVGIMECKEALERCDGDILLAEGWLKYYGCAISVRGMTHEEWTMKKAEGYKALQTKDTV